MPSVGVETVQVYLQEGCDPVTIPAAIAKRLPLLKKTLETSVGRREHVDTNSPNPSSPKRSKLMKSELRFDKLGMDWESFLLALNKISRVPFLTGSEEQELAEKIGALTLDSKDLNYFHFTKHTNDAGEICVKYSPTVYELCEFFGGSMEQIRKAHDIIFGTVHEREQMRKCVEAEERRRASRLDASVVQKKQSTSETTDSDEQAPGQGAAPIFLRRPRRLVDLHDHIDGQGKCTIWVNNESPEFKADGTGLFPEDVVITAPDEDFDYLRTKKKRKKDFAEEAAAEAAGRVYLTDLDDHPSSRYKYPKDLAEAKRSQGVAIALSLVSGLEFSTKVPDGVRLALAGGSVTKAITGSKFSGSDIDLYLVLPFLEDREAGGYHTASISRSAESVETTARRDAAQLPPDGEVNKDPTQIFREVVSALYHHVNTNNREYYIDTIHRSAHAITFHVVRRQDVLKLHTRVMGRVEDIPDEQEEEYMQNPQGNRAAAWLKHPDVETFPVQIMTTVYPNIFDILQRFDLPSCQLACEIMPLAGPVRFLTTARGSHALQSRTNLLSQECATVCVFRARKYWMRGFGLAVPVHSPNTAVNLFRVLEEYYQKYCADKKKAKRLCDSEDGGHRYKDYGDAMAVLKAIRRAWRERNRPAGPRQEGDETGPARPTDPFRWIRRPREEDFDEDNDEPNPRRRKPESADFTDAAEETRYKFALKTLHEICKERDAIANEITPLNFRAFWDSLPLLERLVFFLRENDKAERETRLNLIKSVGERQLYWDLTKYYRDLEYGDRIAHGGLGGAAVSIDESIFSAEYYAAPGGDSDDDEDETKLFRSLSDESKARVAEWLQKRSQTLADRARHGLPNNSLEDRYENADTVASAPCAAALRPASELSRTNRNPKNSSSAASSGSASTFDHSAAEQVPPLSMGLGLFNCPADVVDHEGLRGSGGAPSVRKIGGGVGLYFIYDTLRKTGTHPRAMWLYFSNNIEHILRPERRSIPIDKGKYFFFMHHNETDGRLVVPTHLQTLKVFGPHEAEEAKMVPDENRGLSAIMKAKIWAGRRGAWHARRGVSFDATARELLGMPSLE